MKLTEAYQLFLSYQIPITHYTLRKWCREGKIKATIQTKSEGYELDELDVYKVITEKIVTAMQQQSDYTKGFRDGYYVAKKIYEDGVNNEGI